MLEGAITLSLDEVELPTRRCHVRCSTDEQYCKYCNCNGNMWKEVGDAKVAILCNNNNNK